MDMFRARFSRRVLVEKGCIIWLGGIDYVNQKNLVDWILLTLELEISTC
jgi:hypothetical protein